MRRLLSVILILILMIPLSACGDKPAAENTEEVVEASAETEPVSKKQRSFPKTSKRKMIN